MKTLNYFCIFLEHVEGKNIVTWVFFVVLWHHFAKYVNCVKKFDVPPNKHCGCVCCVRVVCAVCGVCVVLTMNTLCTVFLDTSCDNDVAVKKVARCLHCR